MTPSSGRPSSLQDVPLVPSAIEASALVVTVPLPLPIVPVQEATLVVGVDVLATLVGLVMTPSSIIVAPLLSPSVATMSAPHLSPPPALAPRIPPSIVLTSASPFSSSHPLVSLDHIYTSSDVDPHGVWDTSLNRRL